MTGNNFSELEDKLCKMNTLIDKYLKTKEARDCCSRGGANVSTKILNLIIDVLDEKISQYEKQIIELSMKLAYIKL